MPISREEFDAGRLDIAVPIRQLLSANPHLAFSAEEVQVRLRDKFGRRASLGELAVAMNRLVEEGLVEEKQMGLERRYTIKDGGEVSGPSQE